MSEQLPFTMRALERQLENLCGADGYEIKLNHNAYHLSVKIMVVERNNVEDVRKMLLRMVPANLLLFFIVQAPEAQTTVHIGAAQCGGYSRVTLPQLAPDRKAYSLSLIHIWFRRSAASTLRCRMKRTMQKTDFGRRQ